MPSIVPHRPDPARVNLQVCEFTLNNGMRVVVNPDDSAPGVAINLWYRVGSGDEVPGATGFAHLFEHLMFAGSAQVASGEHLAIIQAMGGSANATTGFDRTNYFETVAPGGLEMALWLEADRMASLNVNQQNLDTQREVVREEKRQRYDNVPYGDQLELLLRLNFPETHPYRHPTIGSMADLDAAVLDDIRAFHTRWYQPSQAIMSLAGAITTSRAEQLADRYFGGLGSQPRPRQPATPVLPPHNGIPEMVVKRDLPRAMIAMCWRTPPVDHPDRNALDLALEILGGNQSARLHRALTRDNELAEAVGAYDFGLCRGTSLTVLSARNRDQVETGQIADTIIATITELAEHGPSEAEMLRAKVSTERQWFSMMAPVDERADYLSFSTVHFNDPQRINTELATISDLTCSDIQRVAASWLAPQASAILRYERRPA